MNSDNGIKIAFVISIICHSFIFFSFPAINVFFPKKDSQRQLQVTYYQIKQLKAVLGNKVYSRPLLKKVGSGKTDSGAKDLTGPSGLKLEKVEKKVKKTEKKQKPKEKLKKVAKKRKLSIEDKILQTPPEIKKMPTYLDYVELVRRKIKSTAAGKYRQPGLCGEIFLKFVLYSDGKLAAIKVVDEQSCDKRKLKDIAREVIANAAPFESFPGDLNFKQLSFSVVISFE